MLLSLWLSASSSLSPPLIKMKYLAILILLLVCLYCEANENSVCQVYDAKTKSLEKYCGGSLPSNCSAASASAGSQPINDAASLENLKFQKCDSADVLNTTKLYPNIRTLDISNSDYNTIDWLNVQLNNLMHLNASHNKIENITNLLHQFVPHIKTMDLSHNKLHTITIDSFGTLNELIDINLSNNLLQHINADAFSKIATNLEHIDLSNNNLVGIPELPACKKLRILHLEENTIKNFTCQRIPWRESLSAIYLSWTYVERFDGSEHCTDKEFRVIWNGDEEGILRTTNGSTVTYELHCNQQSFRNLRSFRAGRNAFVNIVTLIGSFDSTLNELDVSGNAIGQWDQMELKRFNDLRKLALRDTQLKYFNLDMIESARFLQSLDISNNHLDQVQSISTLRIFGYLSYFNVSGNQFQYDTTLKILNYLTPVVEVLDLSDSYVGKLYAGTFDNFVQGGGYTTLKILHLRNTNLAFADDRNPFEQLNHLHSLDISRNNLSDVNFRTLSDTLIKLHSFEAANCGLKDPLNVVQYFGQALEKLSLSGNRIDGGRINEDAFQALNNLNHLNLSATELQKFDFKTIVRQEWLQTLDISKNQLPWIDLNELPHFTHLKNLYLNDNKLPKLDGFKPNESPDVSLALAQNQIPCMYLKRLKFNYPNVKYIGHQLNQKHGDDCRSSTQAIGDFLGSVYDTVKFW